LEPRNLFPEVSQSISMMETLTVSEIMFAYFPSGEKYAYKVIKTHDNYATSRAQGHTFLIS
jgi:hypothetical protein